MWTLLTAAAAAADIHQACDDGEVAACEQLLAYGARLQLAGGYGTPQTTKALVARVLALRSGEPWPPPLPPEPPVQPLRRDFREPSRLDGVPLELGSATGVAWWRTHDGALDQTVAVERVCGGPVLVGDTVWLVRKTELRGPCSQVQAYAAQTGELLREEAYDGRSVHIGAGESLLLVWPSGQSTDLLSTHGGTWSTGTVGYQSGELAGTYAPRGAFTMYRRGVQAAVFTHAAPCALGAGSLYCMSEDRRQLELRDAEQPDVVLEILRTVDEPLHPYTDVALECHGAVLTGFGDPIEIRPCPVVGDPPPRDLPPGARTLEGHVIWGTDSAAKGADVFLVPVIDNADPAGAARDSEGAEIWEGYRAASGGRRAVARTRTDDQGRFVFRTVDAALPWEIHALSGVVQATARIRADHVDLDITLTGPAIAHIRHVEVVDRRGHAVAGQVFSGGVGYPTDREGGVFVPDHSAFAVAGKWWSVPSRDGTLTVDRKRPLCTIRTPTGEPHPDHPAGPCDAVDARIEGAWTTHAAGGDITMPTRVSVTLPDGTSVPQVWLDGFVRPTPVIGLPVGPHTLWVSYDRDRFLRLDVDVSGDHTLVADPTHAEALPTTAIYVRDADGVPIPEAMVSLYHPVWQTHVQRFSDTLGRLHPWIDAAGRIPAQDGSSHEPADLTVPLRPVDVTDEELPDGPWYGRDSLAQVVLEAGHVRIGDTALAGEEIAPGVFLFPAFRLEYSQGRPVGLQTAPGSVVAVHTAAGALVFLLPGGALWLEHD